VVSKVYYLNSEQFPAIANDYQQVKERVENKPSTDYNCVFEALPPVRRTLSIPDKIKHGDTTTALGMASLALINLPEDWKDIKGSYRQLKGEKASYDMKSYQHDFSFFRGTTIEEWLHKHIKSGNKWASLLRNKDITLADTPFGEKIIKLVKADEEDLIKTTIKNAAGEEAFAMKYAGSEFAQLTGRALRRTTLLGVGAIALLELPKIFKSDEKIKQTAKSAMNVASITAGIGYCGAIGAKYGGSAGSLIGMGVGAILGCKLSTKAQEVI